MYAQPCQVQSEGYTRVWKAEAISRDDRFSLTERAVRRLAPTDGVKPGHKKSFCHDGQASLSSQHDMMRERQ